MDNYRTLEFNNLDVIAKKCLDLIKNSKPIPTSSQVYYLDRDNDEFQNIPELRESMEKYGLLDYWWHTGIVVGYDDGLPIHLDSGDTLYAIVVPLENTINTWTVFYNTDQAPIKKYVKGSLIPYFYYDPIGCTEINRIESITPAMIKVKVPHSVDVNSTSLPRIGLTIRLYSHYPGFDQLDNRNK